MSAPAADERLRELAAARARLLERIGRERVMLAGAARELSPLARWVARGVAAGMWARNHPATAGLSAAGLLMPLGWLARLRGGGWSAAGVVIRVLRGLARRPRG